MSETAPETQTLVTIGESYGGKPANATIEHVRFYGRPNFNGEMDRFKDDRRKFTVIIPEDAVEPLRQIGYNVKTTVPDAEAQEAGRETVNHLKVMVDFRFDAQFPGDIEREKGPDVWVIQGESREKLNSKTVGIIDRSRFEDMDIEIRGWEYDPEESPGVLSARLVMFVGVMRQNRLNEKYGNLR